MCGLFFFFFSLISQTSSQQTAKDFCLKKYLRTQAVQLQHQLLALAWQQLMPVWRVEGKAAPTHWPQKKHKTATKKASRSCSSRIGICRKTKFNWAADHTVSPEKNVLFSSLSSWHALLLYACPPCLYSSCWMHVKVKIFSTFQRDVVLQRSSMSLLAQAISARCPRSTSRRGKVDGIDKMFCSICERASRRSRHWFVKRGRYICLFKACLVVVLYGQTIDQSFERFCSFFVKGTVWNNLSNLLTQFNVFVHK